MSMPDYGEPSELTDEEFQTRAYTEFKLEKIDEDSLKDVEKTIYNKKINSDNKDFILKFLQGLLKKVQMVKENERKYEGEHNDNVNEYLQRISQAIIQVRNM